MRRLTMLLMGGIIFWGQTLPAMAEDTAFQFFQEEAVENTRVSIASKKDTSIRETPGIVTVISREEILNAGSRDLLDVLTLFAPGLNFGSGVEGGVGPSVRGLPATDGKILLLVDGLEQNEGVFDTMQFGNHYSLDNIERIEIIRGPGSAIYGGFAELAVINIITKGAKENAAYATVQNSQMSKTFDRRGVTTGFGKTVGDFTTSFSGNFAKGHRSQNNITDYYGDTRRLSNQLNNADVNFQIGYKGLSSRTIAKWYNTTQIDNAGANYTNGELIDRYDSIVSELKYDYKPVPGLTLTPRIQYKKDLPWVSDQNYISYTNHKWSEGKTASLTSSWDATPHINTLAGVEYTRNDVYRAKNPGPFEETFKNGQNNIGADNSIVFGQLMAMTNLANFTVGGRYDHSSAFGSAFVPRAAITKVIDRFHVKAMASQSFRTPIGILPNRTLPGNPHLKPEKATTYEAEVGYKISQSLWATVNAFNIVLNKPIVYGTDPVTNLGYFRNFGRVNTQGLESEIHLQQRFVDLRANYSYYEVVKNNVVNFALPDQPDMLIGTPAYRANAIATFKFTKKMSLSPSASYYGTRYAFVRLNEPVKKYSPVTICNANFRIKDLVWSGLELDLGVNDIFDKGIEYMPSYNAFKGTLPGPDRAVLVKLGYEYKF